MLKKCFLLLLISCLAIPVSAAERRKPVSIEGKNVLPLRVLARPRSHIYNSKDLNGGTVKENVPAFQPYYVYTRPSAEDIELQDGWYEVGSDNRGNALGWMQAKDVFEWKQTMCLAYTHPEGRKPVLMFARRGPLADLVQKDTDTRLAEVDKLYHALNTKQIPENFPIRSVEPKQAVDIASQFYLLPILSFEELEIDGREGRLLQIAAATAGGPDARQSTDISQNKDYLDEANQDVAGVGAEVFKAMKMDVVFVSDTTVSMRPYIQATLDVIRQVAQDLGSDPATAQSLRFGVWGYRDPVDKIPGIGYTTFNYTPALLPANDFVQALSKVDVTQVDSDDYAEDVFSGINDAISQTAWTQGAIRIIVLLGDAPGHEPGHKYNASGQSAQTLRAISDDASIYLYAMHVKAPRAKKYHESAEMQFMKLSANPGMQGGNAYFSMSSENIEGFKRIASDITYALTTMLRTVKQGDIGKSFSNADGPGSSPGGAQGEAAAPSEEAMLSQPSASMASATATTGTTGETAPETGTRVLPVAEESVAQEPSAQDLAFQMVKAAMVEWVGKQSGAQAPRDIVAWATDKDLVVPNIQAMEVRLLINKRQLDSLNTILKEVMAAGRRGQIGGEDFFSALQATSAAASRDPNLIKNAKTMADTGLIPEFLSGLPYKSRLMSMNNDLWMSWSVDEQDEFLNELESKIQAYQSIHDRPEGWVALSPEDDPDEHVYPVSLELLP
ncbi:predicted serine/threonine protein kinase PpkA [Desulforapulum autotrophicum HRM2]|uniref:Predicted serine/threonine protein kinase PpkA n=1 Tax=Desulforapulum autotrophicum (strain ATCC 43914 / DSM 3382 / VKM B-1955 / HRM2) TaxID=177437 RepID=C0QJU2_DESAH|nr:VWA domain-containing protein [Desulforapulum autotrophicum]ACN13945.1 predicted serine/threonine protein kinase PpkA [Desulforapulum autotrophicum HRM2]